MSDVTADTPDPLGKAIEANQLAEAALTKEQPEVDLANAWASISSNWLSLVDPRNPEIRRLGKPKRPS